MIYQLTTIQTRKNVSSICQTVIAVPYLIYYTDIDSDDDSETNPRKRKGRHESSSSGQERSVKRKNKRKMHKNIEKSNSPKNALISIPHLEHRLQKQHLLLNIHKKTPNQDLKSERKYQHMELHDTEQKPMEIYPTTVLKLKLILTQKHKFTHLIL